MPRWPRGVSARAGGTAVDDMQVLCCYTQLPDSVRYALPHGTIFRDVSGHPGAYWAAIREYWGKGESLLLVEHDIVLPATAIHQLKSCKEPWCTFPYAASPDELMCHSIGCTRFRPSMQVPLPDKDVPWQAVDGEIRDAILAAYPDDDFFHPHVHGPPAWHQRVDCPDRQHLWDGLIDGSKPCRGYVVHISG